MTSVPQVGQAAPARSLPTLDGRRTDLSALRGRLVIVSFLRHAG